MIFIDIQRTFKCFQVSTLWNELHFAIGDYNFWFMCENTYVHRETISAYTYIVSTWARSCSSYLQNNSQFMVLNIKHFAQNKIHEFVQIILNKNFEKKTWNEK